MTCQSPFSAKIICGECGGFYGSKVWGSNTQYRRTIWRCNEKYKGKYKNAEYAELFSWGRTG